MTVQEFLKNNRSYNIDDIKDFIEGLGNYEDTQRELNRATGFLKASLDLNTNEGYNNKTILSANIVEDPAVLD